MSPSAAGGWAIVLIFVVGYIVGAYFMRESMLKRIDAEVVASLRRHGFTLPSAAGDGPEQTETTS